MNDRHSTSLVPSASCVTVAYSIQNWYIIVFHNGRFDVVVLLGDYAHAEHVRSGPDTREYPCVGIISISNSCDSLVEL